MAILNYFKNVISPQEREKEILGTHKPSQPVSRGPLSGAPLGAMAIAIVVALALLLGACPATGGGGGGGGQPDGGLPSQPSGAARSYICVNGTPSARSDATADGISRCLRCNLFATLEGTSDTIGATCRLTVEVGGATRISAAMVNQFGLSEDNPFDLAVIGTTLYMVGATNAVLYSLNIDSTDTTPDGSAIQVGSLTGGFGVGENQPSGLAAIGNTLYMVGLINDRLYSLNINRGDTIADGSADQVGSLAGGFGVAEGTPTGLAAIGTTLYMVGIDNGRLYRLNINRGDTIADGSADQVGSTASGFGVGESGPTGLAALGATLYMVGENDKVLYSLNTTDGSATQVGSLGARFGVGENFPTGLAALGATLYMVGEGTDVLYALRYQ